MSSAITAIAAVGISAIGTGLSVYSDMQQGAAAEGLANQNAKIQQENARIQLQADRIGALGEINDAQLSEQQAGISMASGKIDEANAYLKGLSDTLQTNTDTKNSLTSARQYDLDASLSVMNASTLSSYATATDQQGSEQIARFREQSAQTMALGQNKIAKSGLVDSGSPLAVQADNAAKIELQAQDINYQANLASTSYRRQAFDQLLGAQRSLLSGRIETRNAATSLRSGRLAQVGMQFGVAGAQLQQAGAQDAYQAAKFRENLGDQTYALADQRYQVGAQGADLTQAEGVAQDRAAQLSAVATGVNGAANIAGSSTFRSDFLPAVGGAVGNSIGTIQYDTGTVPRASAYTG